MSPPKQAPTWTFPRKTLSRTPRWPHRLSATICHNRWRTTVRARQRRSSHHKRRALLHKRMLLLSRTFDCVLFDCARYQTQHLGDAVGNADTKSRLTYAFACAACDTLHCPPSKSQAAIAVPAVAVAEVAASRAPEARSFVAFGLMRSGTLPSVYESLFFSRYAYATFSFLQTRRQQVLEHQLDIIRHRE